MDSKLRYTLNSEVGRLIFFKDDEFIGYDQILADLNEIAKLEAENAALRAMLSQANARYDVLMSENEFNLRQLKNFDSVGREIAALKATLTRETTNHFPLCEAMGREVAALRTTLGRVRMIKANMTGACDGLRLYCQSTEWFANAMLTIDSEFDSILSATPEALANEDRNIEKPCADCSGTGNHFSDIGDEDLDDCSNCEGTGVVLASGEGE